MDLHISYPLNVQNDSLKKKKPTHAVGFATGSPPPFPAIWTGDQIGLWINASAVTKY
jgi:hypothetical protein